MRSEEHQAYSFEDERKRIEECFCAFVEGSLVSHDIDAVLQLFCDDVIGIGMGAQGIVRCREDLRPILMNTRSDVDDSQTAIDYSNMQVRYYGDDYASINAMVSVTTTVRGERCTSHIGQCASLRRIDGQWCINMVQATPLSIDIQDIDSYPLSFAEDEIENYRCQAQFSSIMRRSIIATYKIDFESDSFEEYVAASGSSVAVQQGDPYERIMQESAMVLVDDAMKLEFISTFSIANLKKCYRAGRPTSPSTTNRRSQMAALSGCATACIFSPISRDGSRAISIFSTSMPTSVRRCAWRIRRSTIPAQAFSTRARRARRSRWR